MSKEWTECKKGQPEITDGKTGDSIGHSDKKYLTLEYEDGHRDITKAVACFRSGVLTSWKHWGHSTEGPTKPIAWKDIPGLPSPYVGDR